MPIAALLLLTFAPHLVFAEQRDFQITASLGDNGKMTMTRVYDPQAKTLELQMVTHWTDGSVMTERYRYDSAGIPTEVRREETRKKLTKVAWLKPEGDKVRTHWEMSASVDERLRSNNIGEFKDPSVWWFVTTTPDPSATSSYLDAGPPFFCDPTTSTYIGEKEITVGGKKITARLVRRVVGKNSPQIDIYLDDKGMPVRREWSTGISGNPHRIDELIPSKG